MKKITVAVIGTGAIAILSHAAIVLPNDLNHFAAATPNHKPSPDGTLNQTNRHAADPRYYIAGTNAPVWPPGLQGRPKNKTN
jgi:predicted dehydrogenase